ncbi:cold-shock protein [Bradyrhizobium sp. CCBAU 53415]|uniref:cold-shock protein n=1 Tax=Bradyrhizobium sp. CCBAU 53415 TaxID=1325119 RepID=UPI0023069D59|nr:cold shock domain-containing protein [Bradyrhizobium sp. CCBAU 53415]MDA9469627.1 hypothetical protein [Bradyrhizobium sp. CCBAU 53415]
MKIGTLRKFDEVRGYGFIRPDEGDSDFFVHIKAFKKIGIVPEIGMRLEFEEWPTKDGRRRAGRLFPEQHGE